MNRGMIDRRDSSGDYDFIEKMGEGSYGAVWKAMNKQTSEIGSTFFSHVIY